MTISQNRIQFAGCLAIALTDYVALGGVSHGLDVLTRSSLPESVAITNIVEFRGDAFNLSWTEPTPIAMAGKTVLISAELKTAVSGKFAVGIVDKVANDYQGVSSERHTGSGSWERLSVSMRPRGNAERVIVRVIMARETGSLDPVQLRNVTISIDGATVENNVPTLLAAAAKGKLPTKSTWFFDGGKAQLQLVDKAR